MRAGTLRHRIQIEKQVITQNTFGEPAISWAHYADVWASVEPLNSREFFAAQSVQSEITGKIIIRYLAGVEPTMRITHNAEYYNISGVLPDGKSGKEYLVLMVSKGLTDGR